MKSFLRALLTVVCVFSGSVLAQEGDSPPKQCRMDDNVAGCIFSRDLPTCRYDYVCPSNAYACYQTAYGLSCLCEDEFQKDDCSSATCAVELDACSE